MIGSTEWPSADEQRPTCSGTVLVKREGLECAPFDLR